MLQIFLLGSSNVYGAGAETAGWADLVKQKIHHKMYAPEGVGHKYEVFNFGKSGATVDFVKNSFPEQLTHYGRGGKVITVVSVGANNARAVDRPDNFHSTPQDFTRQMSALLDLLKKSSSAVVVLGSTPYAEAKTNPKANPLTGGLSYFTNSRRLLFDHQTQKLCSEKNLAFLRLDIDEKTWLQKYLYEDGIHPNQAGYQLLADLVYSTLTPIISQYG
jgi:lysophospholipase L1-like esterase